MVFGIKKKATKVAKKKNVVKEFIDGKEKVVEEVPEKIQELKIPVPSPEESTIKETHLTAEEVYAEGRSVGFQEGMIYAINLIQDHLQQHQTELREKLAQKEEAKK